jgi:hypothetical protein
LGKFWGCEQRNGNANEEMAAVTKCMNIPLPQLANSVSVGSTSGYAHEKQVTYGKTVVSLFQNPDLKGRDPLYILSRLRAILNGYRAIIDTHQDQGVSPVKEYPFRCGQRRVEIDPIFPTNSLTLSAE